MIEDSCEKIAGKFVSCKEVPVTIIEKFGVFYLRTVDGFESEPLKMYNGKILRRSEVKNIKQETTYTGLYVMPSEIFEDKMAEKYFCEPWLVIQLLHIFRKELADADSGAVAIIRHEGKRLAKKKWDEFLADYIEYCNGDEDACFECFSETYCKNNRLNDYELRMAINRKTDKIKI